MRSPLNVIVGFSNCWSSEVSNPEEYVRNLRFSALQLLNLINDILDLSAIEAGKVAFDNTPFDLVYNVDKVFQAMEQRAVDKVDLGQIAADHTACPLKGDAAKLISPHQFAGQRHQIHPQRRSHSM